MPIIHEVALEIYRTRKALIPSFYLWRIADSLLPSIVGTDKAKRTSGHGADAITSVVMHLRPELIRQDLIPGPPSPRKIMGMPVSGVPTVKFEEAEIAVPVEFDELASDGVSSASPNSVLDLSPTRPRFISWQLLSRHHNTLKKIVAQTIR